MTRQADAVIIGDGIAALTTALAAADTGLHCLVLGPRLPGQASRASAGMLAPSLGGFPGETARVAFAARAMFGPYLDLLHDRTGIRVHHNTLGIIELGAPRDDVVINGATLLDAQSLSHLEPHLVPQPAVLHPRDGSVDNVALMDALDVAVGSHPRLTRRSERATRIAFHAGHVSVVTDGAATYSAAVAVLAAGAWASHLTGLPDELPVKPLRGELIELQTLAAPLAHVVYGASGYLVPRQRTLVIGATSEDAGFDAAKTLAAHEGLRRAASTMSPSTSRCAVVEHHVGLRPMTPDGLPILGRSPGQPRLVYACGYSRNGILLAPWAAGHLSQLLEGPAVQEIEPFHIGRFTREK